MSESILQIKKGYDGMRAFLFDIDPEMSMWCFRAYFLATKFTNLIVMFKLLLKRTHSVLSLNETRKLVLL